MNMHRTYSTVLFRQYGGLELTNMKTPLIFSRPSVAGELLSFSLQLESDSSLLRIHLLSRLSMYPPKHMTLSLCFSGLYSIAVKQVSEVEEKLFTPSLNICPEAC
jgi:hypothetical protein